MPVDRFPQVPRWVGNEWGAAAFLYCENREFQQSVVSHTCFSHLQMLEDDPRLCKLTRASECTLDEEENEEILDVEQASSPLPNVSPTTCCLICLEEWKAGDFICQSAGCRHSFHQTCIISWLVNHRSDCPACRQAFLPTEHDEGDENDDDAAGAEVEEEYEA